MSWTNTSVQGLPKLQLAAFTREMFKVNEIRNFEFVIRPEQMAVWVDDQTRWGYLTGGFNDLAYRLNNNNVS